MVPWGPSVFVVEAVRWLRWVGVGVLVCCGCLCCACLRIVVVYLPLGDVGSFGAWVGLCWLLMWAFCSGLRRGLDFV